MTKVLIDVIAGARPNFMKIAPIMRAFQSLNPSLIKFELRLIHTGQHYDYEMSENFFEQLEIPKPQFNFGIGSGTHFDQTAAIMISYGQLLSKKRSDLCIVVGDVNSTMACAITAKKNNIMVAHVEAGLRSGDRSMPEEINRILTDSISDYFFTTSEIASQNLYDTGSAKDKVFFVGNTMIDTLLLNFKKLKPPQFWFEKGLENKKYFILTLHRPSNVDSVPNLMELLNNISQSLGSLICIFPLHPRTARSMVGSYIPKNIHIVPSQPYLEFNYLVKGAIGVITDSGGITEETTVLGVPCVTLRNSTERPETVSIGTNELVGNDKDLLHSLIKKMISKDWKRSSIPPLWDGSAGKRIAEIITKDVLARVIN